MRTESDSSDRLPEAEAIARGNATADAERLPIPITIGLIVVLLAAGVAGAIGLVHMRKDPPRRNRAMPAPFVKTQLLVPEDVTEIFVGYGSARADQQTTLAAEISGPIAEIPENVKDGSRVISGQILVRIDDRQYRQQLDRARSRLSDAEAQLTQLDVEKANVEKLIAIAEVEVDVNHEEYKRLTDLYEKQVASKTEWDQARLTYRRSTRELQGLHNQVTMIEPRRQSAIASRDSLTAEVKLAELDVERCSIRAPFDGQVQELSVEVGDRVQPGSPICAIIDPRHIEIPLELPSGVRDRTTVGDACRLTMDSMPGAEWHATVSRISPDADTRSRTFTAYIEVDNETQKNPIVPGFFLTGHVSGPTLKQVLAIPRGVIFGESVLIAEDNIAKTHEVEIERIVGERAIIASGIEPGQHLITTNLDVLHDGAAIRCDERVNNKTPETPAAETGGDA